MLEIDGYRIDQEIYRSSTVIVFRGIREEDGVPVIIKTHTSLYAPEYLLSRLSREYRIAGKLTHRNIARVLSLETNENRLTLVSEDYGGVQLQSYIPGHGMHLGEFLPASLQILEGVRFIHQNDIIHGHIHPGNILIQPKTGLIKLIGFGGALDLSDFGEKSRSPKSILDALDYIIPGKMEGSAGWMDYRIDFYFLGVTFYTMLCGHLPFRVNNPSEVLLAHAEGNPVPLHEIDDEIPDVISAIISKLLSKDPDQRYQTIQGIKADLGTCFEQVLNQKTVRSFSTGKYDFIERMRNAGPLSGRKEQWENVEEAVNDIRNGRSGILLISGEAGSGKTSMVEKVRGRLQGSSCIFCLGDSEPFTCQIPYHVLNPVFSNCIDWVLSRPDPQIQTWKENLLDAAGGNSAAFTDVIPDFSRLFRGSAGNPVALAVKESQFRFRYLFRTLLHRLARPDHPLVLAVDNLEHADRTSLDLIRTILRDPPSHFLFIGTSSLSPAEGQHLLQVSTEKGHHRHVQINTLHLQPLPAEAVTTLLAEILGADPDEVSPLAEMLHEKVGGNPYTVREFFFNLIQQEKFPVPAVSSDKIRTETGLVSVQEEMPGLEVGKDGTTFMKSKLEKLPSSIQHHLKVGACLGMRFDSSFLAALANESETAVLYSLDIAAREGFLRLFRNEWIFQHEIAHQAASSLLKEQEERRFNGEIANLLYNYYIRHDENHEKLLPYLFHLEKTCRSELSEEDRIHQAQLCLKAAQQCRGKIALQEARELLARGIRLLPHDAWESQYPLAFQLYKESIEAGYATNHSEQAEACIDILLDHAENELDLVPVHEFRIQHYLDSREPVSTIEYGVKVLERLGIRIKSPLTPFSRLKAFTTTKRHSIQQLLNELPRLSELADEKKSAAIKVLAAVAPEILRIRQDLFPFITRLMLFPLLKQGRSLHALPILADFGRWVCAEKQDYELGDLAGKTAVQMINREPSQHLACRILLSYGKGISHWKNPLNKSREYLEKAIQAGLESGDRFHIHDCIVSNAFIRFFLGEPLGTLEAACEKYHRRLQILFGTHSFPLLEFLQQVIVNLRSDNREPSPHLKRGAAAENPEGTPGWESKNHTVWQGMYVACNTMYLFLCGEPGRAAAFAEKNERYTWKIRETFACVEFRFYQTMSLFCSLPKAEPYHRGKYWRRIRKNIRQFKFWAQTEQHNFYHKYTLLLAEQAALDGKTEKALRCFEQAMDYAGKNGFDHDKTLASERCGIYLNQINLARTLTPHIRNAYQGYLRWEMAGRANGLIRRYPKILRLPTAPGYPADHAKPAVAVGSDQPHYDEIKTTRDSLQLISSDIDLIKLLENSMKSIMEKSGAEKGFIILNSDHGLKIEAQANAFEERITVHQSIPLEQCDGLSAPLVLYVSRTGERVLFPDNAKADLFENDAYFQLHTPKSLLCMPIKSHTGAVGIAYLESTSVDGTFLGTRLDILERLLSQTAISLRHAWEVKQLKEMIKKRSRQLKETQEKLIEKAQKAGMADIALSILHNVGNLLNSVIVSGQIILDTVHAGSHLRNMQEAGKILRENLETLETFISSNPRGKKLIQYYLLLEEGFEKEFSVLRQNSERLMKNVNSLKTLIASQQAYATSGYQKEKLNLETIMEEVLHANAELMQSNDIKLIRQFEGTPLIMVQKEKVAKTIQHILNNAVEAMAANHPDTKEIIITTTSDQQNVYAHIKDRGEGITEERTDLLFTQGFTTRPDKPGFGLHDSANFMREMGGDIHIESGGKNRGSQVILRFPLPQTPVSL